MKFTIFVPLILAFHLISSAESTGFLYPKPGTQLTFPADHGNHPDYRIEWWYLTGHFSVGNRVKPDRYGFQYTLFRYTESPGEKPVFLGHASLLDTEENAYVFEERFDDEDFETYSRENILDARIHHWTLKMTDPQEETMNLSFTSGPYHLDLQLRPTKPLVRFGRDGTSRKGADPEARSYYLTFPRLEVTGWLSHEGKGQQVFGEAWMDHEIATRQLDADLAGWDWVAIQFFDGSELKAYRLRQQDGEMSPFSQAIWIDELGNVTYVDAKDFSWQNGSFWESSESGIGYPTSPTLVFSEAIGPGLKSLRISPKVPDQEFRGETTSYYEGACNVLNPEGELIGQAYLELVGYGGLPPAIAD